MPDTAAEGVAAPPALSATTVTEYDVPLVRPVIEADVVLELAAKRPLT